MNCWYWGVERRFVMAGLVVMCLATEAHGQSVAADNTAEPGNLDEIVVTATRRDEQLGKIPISVQAFSQADMDAQGVRQIDDIATLTPGLTFSHTSGETNGNNTNIAIRGIQSSVGAGTTGIYIDDTPIQTRQLATSSTNAYPQIFDLGQVEVLRGPQGTLFGAGAEGGAVRFITPQPSLEKYSVYARTDASFTDGGAPSYEAGVAGGGPIVDGELGFRASAWYRRYGGWISRADPVTGETIAANSNSQDDSEFRLALLLEPVANLKITPSFLYQRTAAHDSSLYYDSLSNPADSDFNNGRTLAQPTTDKFTLTSLSIDYDFGPVSLVSNSSFFNRQSTGIKDDTNWIRLLLGLPVQPTIPGESSPTFLRDSQNVITQELRVSSKSGGTFVWVAGLFFSHAKQFADENYLSPDLDQAIMQGTAGAPFCPAAGCDVADLFGQPLINGKSYFVGTEDTLDKQFAGFGQLDYHITDRLTLTAGLRAEDERYTNVTVTAGPLVGGVAASGGKQVEHPVTPRGAISFQLDPQNLLYASATKGYRPGGANIVVSLTCGKDLAEIGLKEVPTSYNSDNVWAYEIGHKGNLADGRLQVNTSLFWIKWNKIQQEVELPDCGGGFVGNVGSAVSKGFDLESQFRPTEFLSLGLNGGYTEATYSETVHGGADSIITEKGESIGVPKWSGAAFGQYEFPAFGLKAYARADFQFIGEGPKFDPNVYGYDPALYPADETKLLKLRVGALIDEWNVSIYANNVTNDHPVLSRGHDTISSPLFNSYTYPPRTIGITATMRF